jgi:hypothetical protein
MNKIVDFGSKIIDGWKRESYYILALLIIVSISIRLVIIKTFPTIPFSDYSVYHQQEVLLANNEFIFPQGRDVVYYDISTFTRLCTIFINYLVPHIWSVSLQV